MNLFRFWRRHKSHQPRTQHKRLPSVRPSVESLEDRIVMTVPVPVSNPIVAENQLPGTPQSVWDVGPGNDTIDGFTTQISYNVGQTVDFKINTPSTNYLINIYRMGYYGGDGSPACRQRTDHSFLGSGAARPVHPGFHWFGGLRHVERVGNMGRSNHGGFRRLFCRRDPSRRRAGSQHDLLCCDQ